MIVGLNGNRNKIYQRINQRVDLMMDQGLLDEARFVYDNRAKEHQVLQAIGYKEFFPLFCRGGHARRVRDQAEDCITALCQAAADLL